MIRLHQHEDVSAELGPLAAETRSVVWQAGDGPAGDVGLVRDALQEVAEARLLAAIVGRKPLPGPEEIGVGPEEYLLGLGDVVGEVRRLALEHLRAGETSEAEERLVTMESLYRTLMRFDTTRAIVSLKPKQDTARSLVERTRGDVTMGSMIHRAGRAPPKRGGT